MRSRDRPWLPKEVIILIFKVPFRFIAYLVGSAGESINQASNVQRSFNKSQ